MYRHPHIVPGVVRGWLPTQIKEYDVCHNSLKWRLHPSDNSVDRQIWLYGQTKEEAEIQWLTSHFAARQICFFDIGANSGLYTMRVGHAISPKSRIFSVEPNPILCERLRTNLALNDIGNVHLLQCAIAAERGELRLRFTKTRKLQNLGRASLHPERGNIESNFKVDVVPLAELAKDHDIEPIHLLKIDVEGFEDQVLSPYLNTLRDELLPEVISLEHKHQSIWRTDLLNEVIGRGYVIAFENNNTLILELADRRRFR